MSLSGWVGLACRYRSAAAKRPALSEYPRVYIHLSWEAAAENCDGTGHQAKCRRSVSVSRVAASDVLQAGRTLIRRLADQRYLGRRRGEHAGQRMPLAKPTGREGRHLLAIWQQYQHPRWIQESAWDGPGAGSDRRDIIRTHRLPPTCRARTRTARVALVNQLVDNPCHRPHGDREHHCVSSARLRLWISNGQGLTPVKAQALSDHLIFWAESGK